MFGLRGYRDFGKTRLKSQRKGHFHRKRWKGCSAEQVAEAHHRSPQYLAYAYTKSSFISLLKWVSNEFPDVDIDINIDINIEKDKYIHRYAK